MNDDLPFPEPVHIDVDLGPTTLCINLDKMGEKGLKLDIIVNEQKFVFTKEKILKFLKYIQRGFDE